MKQQKTSVVFRKFKEGDIIAIFPYHRTWDGGKIECYQHNGQHCQCEADIAKITLPANTAEYNDLKIELERIGYNLSVKKRIYNPVK